MNFLMSSGILSIIIGVGTGMLLLVVLWSMDSVVNEK